MNRLDEIKASALDVAQHVTQDPEKRAAMADDLIGLIGLMIQAVGKFVAAEGESDLNDPEDFEDRVSAHTRYLAGEQIQRGATWAVEESVVADLARYEDSKYGAPVWRPRCPECHVRVGLYSDVQYGAEGRTVTELVHKDDCHTGRRCQSCKAELGHYPSRPDNIYEEPHLSVTEEDACEARRVTVFDLGPADACPILPGGQGPACDWDATCPVHGMPALARLSDRPVDICPGCGAEPSHGTECVDGA